MVEMTVENFSGSKYFLTSSMYSSLVLSSFIPLFLLEDRYPLYFRRDGGGLFNKRFSLIS